MSLRILLADDSMTAQNMGKKILSDAGYEVTAVSNGAAALKKSTELKPDLVVLDIYMPGYTGLEVCERLKNAPDTAHIPVMLTVGKLEPYRPEEGARVRAEGVIIKPFEATDLLAAVQKISSSVAAPVPAAEPETPPAPPAPFVVAPLPVEMPTLSSPEDVVGANPLDVSLPSFDAAGASHSAMPAFDIDPLRDFAVAPAAAVPQPLSLDAPEVVPPAAASATAINLDFLRAPAETPVVPDATTVEGFEPTSAPQVEIAGVALDYSLEPTHRPHGASIDIGADPSLVTDPADMATFALRVGADGEDLAQTQGDPLDEMVPPPQPEGVEAAPLPEMSAPQSDFAMPPLTFNTSESGRELDVVELFHEEYDPAADGSIELSVPDRQSATPPPVPVYENAGVEGYAVTPAMRDYLERQQEVAAAASTGFADGDTDVLAPEVEVEATAPEATEVVAAVPVIELPHEAAPEESPLDVDALLGCDLDIESVGATEVAAEAVPQVLPETPEPMPTEPEPAAVASVFDLADFDAAPIETVAEAVEPEPSVEAEVETANVEPFDLAPEAAGPAPVVAEPASPMLEEAIEEVSVLTTVAPEPEPEPQPESVAESAPQVEAAIAQIPDAPAEALTDVADGLSAVDRARIAGVIQRVFDRYKPQIIADITRELMK